MQTCRQASNQPDKTHKETVRHLAGKKDRQADWETSTQPDGHSDMQTGIQPGR